MHNYAYANTCMNMAASRRRASRHSHILVLHITSVRITTSYIHIKALYPNAFTAAGVSLIEYLLSNHVTTTLVVLFRVSTYHFGDTTSAYICS